MWRHAGTAHWKQQPSVRPQNERGRNLAIAELEKGEGVHLKKKI
jgi:hypothetical protein